MLEYLHVCVHKQVFTHPGCTQVYSTLFNGNRRVIQQRARQAMQTMHSLTFSVCAVVDGCSVWIVSQDDE